MRKKYSLLVIFLVFIIVDSCCKSEDEFGYTDLKDTLVKVEGAGYGNFENQYILDIDKDKKSDIIITLATAFTHFSDRENIKITTQNGYKISYSENDTRTLPKEYLYGDTILLTDEFTDKQLTIKEEEGGGSLGGGTYSSYGLPFNKSIYIAFRQENENTTNLAWLNIKVVSSTSIIIRSCRFFNDVEYLVIK